MRTLAREENDLDGSAYAAQLEVEKMWEAAGFVIIVPPDQPQPQTREERATYGAENYEI